MPLTLRPAARADVPDCGRVCCDAFNSIATSHGFPGEYPSVETALVSELIEHPGFSALSCRMRRANRGKRPPRAAAGDCESQLDQFGTLLGILDDAASLCVSEA